MSGKPVLEAFEAPPEPAFRIDVRFRGGLTLAQLSFLRWVEGGVNAPRRPDEDMDLRPVRPLKLDLIPADRTLNDMLEAGEIDAYFGARRPDALARGRNVARLFPDYRERVASRRENGRKASSYISSGMPGPSSATVMMYSVAALCAEMYTCCP